MGVRAFAERWGDWAIALAFALAAEGMVLTASPEGVAMPGGTLAAAALALAITLPLAWRRRRPMSAFAVVIAASTFAWVLTNRPAQAPVVFFLAAIVAFFSVGAYSDDRRGLGAGMAGLVVFATATVVADHVRPHGDVRPGAWLVYVVAWLAGRELRRRRFELERLRGRAAELERDREARARAAVAEERRRIARELHDVVAHSVSVMVVQAQAGPRLLDTPERALNAFRAIEASGREALVELRRLLGILRTADDQLAIGPQPGLGSLPSLVEQMREAGLPVTLQVEGEAFPLSPGVDLAAYRILQEALTNTLRHAGRASAAVRVSYGPRLLELEARDNGQGVNGTAESSGHGLVGMRERAALYGGEVVAGPDGDGYLVRVRLPLSNEVSA
jgi:signal transduction histidine kinase